MLRGFVLGVLVALVGYFWITPEPYWFIYHPPVSIVFPPHCPDMRHRGSWDWSR